MTSRPLVDVSERAVPAALAEHVLFRGWEREEGTFGGGFPWMRRGNVVYTTQARGAWFRWGMKRFRRIWRVRTVVWWMRRLLVAGCLVMLVGVPALAEAQDEVKPPDRRMQAEAHYELGVMYHERVFESLDLAIAEYEKSVKMKPDYAEAHYNLALSYHTKAKLGTDDKALYRKASAEYKLYLKYSPQGELANKAKQNLKVVEAKLRP